MTRDELLREVRRRAARRRRRRHVAGAVEGTAALIVLAVLLIGLPHTRSTSLEVNDGPGTTAAITTITEGPTSLPAPTTELGPTTTTPITATPTTATPTTARPTTTPPPSTVLSTTGGPTTTVPPDIRSVDLRNFTYPTTGFPSPYPSSLCAEAWQPTEPTVTLTDGRAVLHAPTPEQPDATPFQLFVQGDVLYGDVTGDGRTDAVVVMSCVLDHTDGVALVVSMVEGTPKVIYSLMVSGTASAETRTDASGAEYRYEPFERVLSVDAVDGKLHVRWRQTNGPTAVTYWPQREITITYDWDGQRFTPAGESDEKVIPPTPPSAP